MCYVEEQTKQNGEQKIWPCLAQTTSNFNALSAERVNFVLLKIFLNILRIFNDYSVLFSFSQWFNTFLNRSWKSHNFKTKKNTKQ